MEESKKSIIAKTWDRCRSIGGRSTATAKKKKKVVPQAGWFPVHVGEGKERFLIRTAYLNHPIFRSLLKEAESVLGYSADGPIELPCDAESFRSRLWEIELDVGDDGPTVATCPSPLPFFHGYEMLSPARSPWKPLRLSGRSRSCSYSSEFRLEPTGRSPAGGCS